MPSSLIIGALVVAWLVVLVPMVARRRQEVARTADTALAARVVPRGATASERTRQHSRPVSAADRRRGGASPRARLEEYAVPDENRPENEPPGSRRAVAGPTDAELTAELPLPENVSPEGVPAADMPAENMPAADMPAADMVHEEMPPADADDLPAEPPAGEDGHVTRRYRQGRGGYDAEAAELAAAAKYALRRRVVLALLLATVAALVAGAAVAPQVYWVAGGLAVALAGYLTYLRRQVRIESEIRRRRGARMRSAQTIPDAAREPERAEHGEYDESGEDAAEAAPAAAEPPRPSAPVVPVRPGTTVVDHDDGDPAFDDLDDPDVLPYRRAAGQ